MLDKTTKENIINSYIEDIKEFRCNHQHYVEACGLYCPVTHSWSIDMSGKLNSKCNTNCPHYSQPDSQIRSAQVIELINNVKIDVVDNVINYIANNTNATINEVLLMLQKEREKSYI